MPSSKVPATTLIVGNGPAPAINNGGGAASGLIAHINDPIDAHDGSAISYDGGPNWADGTTNPAGEVESQLDKIVTDLNSTVAGATGSHRVGGNVTAIWRSTKTLAGGSVGELLDQIVLDLSTVTAADSGARQVGVEPRSAWLGGRVNAAASVYEALEAIINDLGAAAANDDGAERVGAETRIGTWAALNAGSVASQIQDLIDTTHFAATMTFGTQIEFNDNQLLGDTEALIRGTQGTIPAVSNRKLFYEQQVQAAPLSYVRIYANNLNSAGLEITTNARWNGTAWVADNTTNNSGLVSIGISGQLESSVILAPQPATWTAWSATGIFSALDCDLGDTAPPGEVATYRANDGRLLFNNVSATTNSNIAASATPVANTLYAKNVVKAWATIQFLILAPFVNDEEGFNIDSLSRTATYVQVNFSTTFANICTPVVTAADATASDVFCHVHNITTSSCRITWYDSAGAILPPQAGLIANLIVMGRQT